MRTCYKSFGELIVAFNKPEPPQARLQTPPPPKSSTGVRIFWPDGQISTPRGAPNGPFAGPYRP